MEALERRVAHLERSHRWRMLGIGAVGLMVGTLLGAGDDPMHATLRGSSLVIVDAAGPELCRPPIALSDPHVVASMALRPNRDDGENDDDVP